MNIKTLMTYFIQFIRPIDTNLSYEITMVVKQTKPRR
jgi:hypothetical protein